MKNQLSRESAFNEFNNIVEHFNFTISTEVKEKIVSMNINNIDMTTTQEGAEADYFIQKIMSGKIKFDEDSKKIVVNLNDPIKTGNAGEEEVTSSVSFGKITMATIRMISYEEKGKKKRVNLKDINFALMDDVKSVAVLKGMTGISQDAVFMNMQPQDFNDLKMVGGYFFS